MGGEEGGFCPPHLFIRTDTKDWGLVISKQPWQRALAPHGCCPRCWRANHRTTPLFAVEESGLWGVGPLITSSKEQQGPLGDVQGNITQLL